MFEAAIGIFLIGAVLSGIGHNMLELAGFCALHELDDGPDWGPHLRNYVYIQD